MLEKAKAAPKDKELEPLKDDIIKHKFNNPELSRIIKNEKKRKDLIRMISYEFYINKNNVFIIFIYYKLVRILILLMKYFIIT